MRLLTWLVVGLWLVSAPAFADDMTLLGVGGRSGAAPYVGPGDVVAMTFWVGVRAYSAATRGQAAVNICSESGGVDVTCEDELTSATTGKLVLGTVGSTCGSITCTIKTWYDQTGNNYCSGACNFTQTTVANRAIFVISCVTINYPCASFAVAGTPSYSTGSTVVSSFTPHSASWVAYQDNSITQHSLFSDSSSGPNIIQYANTSADEITIYDGVLLNTTLPVNFWRAGQGVFDGSVTNGSIIYVDGSTVATGTLIGVPLKAPFVISTPAKPLDSMMAEFGFADNTVFTGTINSSLNANQHAFYSF